MIQPIRIQLKNAVSKDSLSKYLSNVTFRNMYYIVLILIVSEILLKNKIPYYQDQSENTLLYRVEHKANFN